MKLASAKWVDAWEERVHAAIGAGRVSLTLGAGRRLLRIEAWGLTPREASTLLAAFGGTARPTPAQDWVAATARTGPPIRIRDRLIVVSGGTRERILAARRHPRRAIVTIPASVAFGTGAHATTAMCLRLLADRVRPGDVAADVGTGSGILAIAAALLGASRVEAIDNDPQAVETARRNIAINGVGDRVVVARCALERWRPAVPAAIVSANVYGEVLRRGMAHLWCGIRPGGLLAASGILRSQEADCLDAARRAGFTLKEVRRTGRWVLLVLQRACRSGCRKRIG